MITMKAYSYKSIITRLSWFMNRLGEAVTRHGIHWLLRRYTKNASVSCPSLLLKRVSPHTIRHTTATHLLRAAVDINTIASII